MLKIALRYLFTVALFLFAFAELSFGDYGHTAKTNDDWCNKPLRPGLQKLKEVKTSRPWFKVYNVGENTYAIVEPYNYEETIAYLIIGKDKALLFDTGMGLDSISPVVKQLTKLPVWVLNSHTHSDHIGGNHEFGHILAMNTAYTRNNAAKGYPHSIVRSEVTPAAFCLSRLPKEDTAHYHISPFKISATVNDGSIIDLGERKLQVIATPGHTPDAICLYDKQARYLWCGDSFYEGPIFLFANETNLKAYQRSINTMAKIATTCKWVLPAHNLPLTDPQLIIAAAKDFKSIASGQKTAKPGSGNALLFDCGNFSFQIGRKFMSQIRPQGGRSL